ncbi:MAG: ribonuclease HII [Bacilli bacterium]|nr:ribonuclease HII [Bacilli bacterium]
MKIEDCLDLKIKDTENDNKAIIKKLKLYLETLDNYKYERELREKGLTLIGGVDEVGRGPLVGPVVAACCILPEDFNLDGLTDSKKLSEKKRDYFYEEIKKQAISYGIGIVSEKRIDEINIYEATKEAMIMAINNCSVLPEHVLTDAMKLDIKIPVTPIIKGDLKSITISAASVLAKVTRDRMLYELDKKYPMYDFKNNVGYPTKKHLEAIEKYGIIPEHRRSYAPVAEYLNKHGN